MKFRRPCIECGQLGEPGYSRCPQHQQQIEQKMADRRRQVKQNTQQYTGPYNRLAKIIRQTQPTWVMANAISDRHPDHGRAAKIVERASFLAGLVKIKMEENGEDLPAFRPKNIFHYIQDRNIGPQLS